MFKLRNTTLYPGLDGYEYNATTATDMQVMFESYLSVAAMLPNVLFMFLNTAATKLYVLTLYVLKNLVVLNFLQKHENMFTFSIISQHWDATGSWNPSLWKTRTRLFCIVNTMGADDLAMQRAWRARASAAMIFT